MKTITVRACKFCSAPLEESVVRWNGRHRDYCNKVCKTNEALRLRKLRSVAK